MRRWQFTDDTFFLRIDLPGRQRPDRRRHHRRAGRQPDGLVGSYRSVTTDANGMFTFDGAHSGTFPATLRGSSIVERETTISASSDVTRMSVIPASFDLTAFDEMFRVENARLQRWTSRPALVIVASTMALSSTSAEAFQASAEQMTEDEVSQMVAHLTEGL